MHFSTLPQVLHTSKTHLILRDFMVLMYAEHHTLWSSSLYSSLLSSCYFLTLKNPPPPPATIISCLNNQLVNKLINLMCLAVSVRTCAVLSYETDTNCPPIWGLQLILTTRFKCPLNVMQFEVGLGWSDCDCSLPETIQWRNLNPIINSHI
jgi:hypothetical protein